MQFVLQYFLEFFSPPPLQLYVKFQSNILIILIESTIIINNRESHYRLSWKSKKSLKVLSN